MSGPAVFGLDLSVRSTGVARVLPSGKAWADHILTWKGTKGVTDHKRIEHIRQAVLYMIRGDALPDLVVIEGADYGGHDAGHQLAGLRAIITHDLALRGSRYAYISPATLKLYATGNGRASKDDMLAAARNAWPHTDIANDDEADALWLSAAGLYHLGLPAAAHTPEALNVVKWPDVPGAEITIRAMETTE